MTPQSNHHLQSHIINTMQQEQVRPQPMTHLTNLSRTSIFEAQPTIKNTYTASHLKILHNSLVFIALDQTLQVYSLPKIAENKAPLINVIPLKNIFGTVQKQHYEDLITSVFRKAEKEDFSSQIFNQEQDPKSNILLNLRNISNRLTFFNNNQIRVKSLEFNSKGHLLILLQDGRGAVLIHEAHWSNLIFKTINLNEYTQEKIEHACFAADSTICLIIDNRAIGFDLNQFNKTWTHRLKMPHVTQIYAQTLQKDKLKIFIVGSQEVNVCQVGKKKVLTTSTIRFDTFLSQTFFFDYFFYVVTQTAIVKVDNISLQQTIHYELSEPCELTHIDELGNFSKKSNKNNTESLWLVDSTSNGVFVGLTIRKNGNYKEGRLLVFECNLTYYIERLITNIKNQKKYVDTSDSILIHKSKQNKEIYHEFDNINKKDTSFNGIPLTQEEYYQVSINLGHVFKGKQLSKHKVIEKILTNRFEKLGPTKKKLDYTELVERCCFTGIPFFDEELNYCKKCELFGIANKGDKCVVCLRKMELYE